MIVGSLALMIINTIIHGYVTWLPSFFIRQGMSMTSSFKLALVMAIGAPLGGACAAFAADRIGRKPTVALACVVAVGVAWFYPGIKDPALLPFGGLALTAPIFVLYSMLFGIYVPELFPTEVRLRAAGICNMFGRGGTIVTPFIVVSLFDTGGVQAVTTMMIGLLAALAVVVVVLGIEPRRVSLEQMNAAAPAK